MVLGMSLGTYTLVHVVVSLIGIGSGFVVMYGFLKGKPLNSWIAAFLTTTGLTSTTGFGFLFTWQCSAFIVLGVFAVKRFRLAPVRTMSRAA